MIRVVDLIISFASLAVVLSYPVYSPDETNTWSWPDNQENVLGDYPDRYERLMGLVDRNNPSVYEKRNSPPALSVINPLEVLRQRLELEIARRRIQHDKNMIAANERFLHEIGKRNIDKMTGLLDNDSSQVKPQPSHF